LVNKFLIIVFALNFLLFQPHSYSEITQSEWNAVYNLTEEHIRENNWEKARFLLEYLRNLIIAHNEEERLQDFNPLEMRVAKLIEQNLEQLYQEGQNQLDNSEFSKALITFRKILHYCPDCKDAKELLEKTRNLRNTARGIKQKTVVVTSKITDKRQVGLRVYKPEKCFNGYTLFAHQLMGHVYLIDMDGAIVYRWSVDNNAMFARLKPDGNLLYNCTDSSGLQELDIKSNVIWYYLGDIDHAFQFLKNGNLLIEQNKISISKKNGLPYGCPRIEIISPDKNILWQWRGEKHIEELEQLMGLKISSLGAWENNNTCEILKDNPLAKKDSRFQEGNVIFSYNALDIIGIIDYPTGEIVWAWGYGILDGQHTPTMLDNGNLLIFDNGTNRGWSRVIELNPLTEEIVWEYHAEPKEDFYTKEMGNNFKLPNGNILICESMKNRIFEITPDGEVVWDFISTFHEITGGGIGIYRAYRYSPEYVQPLLDKIEKWRNEQK